jgi:CBS domain-containing protein
VASLGPIGSEQGPSTDVGGCADSGDANFVMFIGGRRRFWIDLVQPFQEPVEKYARKSLYSVPEGASVRDAARIMKGNKVGSVLICSGGSPIGILTERDVLYKVVSEGLDPDRVMVSTVMSSPLVTIRKGERAENALKLMKERGIRRVLVLDEGGRPYGLVVQKQMLGDLVGKAVGLQDSGIRAKSWLERHVMEVSEEAQERFE